jgi:RNA polymerase-interacting CarD/CdnL/TRCF family regulator
VLLFFNLSDNNPEVDVSYSIQMDHMLKGNSDDENADGSAKQQDNQKKRAYAAMIDIADVTKNIATEMKETNRLVKEKIVIPNSYSS